jgi:type I restriction enzyme, S subunit
MAAEWRERPLAELTDNFDGTRVPVKEADRRAGPYPYYGASGIVDRVDGFLFDGEYLLIAEDGENLKTRNTPVAFLARGKFWVNNHAHIVRGNSEADTRFLMYALSATDISGYLTGSTMPKLTQGNMNRIPLLTPPMPEQRAIARILGALDDKIELNRRMNETQEAIARAIFQSWFVDFDPVRAKVERRESRLPASLADLFPSSFEDSQLGEIPTGWQVGSPLSQAKLLSGGTPKTDRAEYWGGGISWASAKDVSQCGEAFLVRTERTISTLGLERSATQLIPVLATVVVARGATTGRMAILGQEMAMNQTCYALASTIDTPFTLHCTLRRAINELVRAAHGSVFDTITTDTFSNSQIVLAPPRILKAFEKIVAPLFSRILNATLQAHTLGTLRDTLLPKLISGELRVKQAERVVEEAI